MNQLALARDGLKSWGPWSWTVAALASIATAVLIGFATVPIPNSAFRRDIAPEVWNYPVWILTAILTGMLIGTYVSTSSQPAEEKVEQPESRSVVGMLGTALAWFAIGCPVCNKIALVALGYSGALTYFAPLQPILAVAAVGLLVYALVKRLGGQILCAMPSGALKRRKRSAA